jgi:hexokinase
VDEKIIGPNELCVVAVDGALYQRFHQYKEFLQETVCQLTTDHERDMCKIELVMAEDLSSIGAAAAIAAAISQ